MPELTKQAQPAVKKLLKSDEEQLYETLGMRIKAIAEDPSKGGSFEPQVTYRAAQMGLKEDIQELGRKLFNRWNVEAYKLVCGSESEDGKDREELLKAFGAKDDAVIAASLSALLVTSLGIAPAIAGVIAVLLLKRFLHPAHEEFCQVWKESLPG